MKDHLQAVFQWMDLFLSSYVMLSQPVNVWVRFTKIDVQEMQILKKCDETDRIIVDSSHGSD